MQSKTSNRTSHDIGTAIAALLRGLARNEAAFECDAIPYGDDSLSIAAKFDRDDFPRVIGKEGGTIRCVQRIAKAIGQEAGMTVTLEVVPPGQPKRDHPVYAPFSPKSDWPKDSIDGLINQLCSLLSRRATVDVQHTKLMSIYAVNLDNQMVADLAFVFRLIGRKVGRVIEIRAKQL